MKAEPKAKKTVLTSAGVLLALGVIIVVIVLNTQNDPVRSQVLDIVRTNTWNYRSDDPGLQMLVQLGPKALQSLQDLVNWRETALHLRYEKLWPSLPAFVRNRLRDPGQQRSMHEAAAQIVYELGPAAARPLTHALCEELAHAHGDNTIYALRALYWSIPESPEAFKALTNWISDPGRHHLFGWVDAWELFPQLPQTVPLLIPCLRNPHLAHEAATVLGKIGTNALSAVPALIEVCDAGIAGPPLKLKYWVRYSSAGEPFLRNRRAAQEALGEIGKTSPEVLAAIERGLVDDDEGIRFAALTCFARLEQPLERRLLGILESFSIRRSIKSQKIIEWVGTLGEHGRPALPWLRQFVTSDAVKRLPQAIPELGDVAIDPDYFRLAVMIAIARIEPKEAHQYLPELLSEVGGRWEAAAFLMETTSLSAEIVAGLEPALNETNRRAALSAYVILALKEDHAKARAVLRDGAATGALNHRLITAQWLWKRTGDTNTVLPLCKQGLEANEGFIGQNAASTLDKMGPAALPAVPALQAALWHKDRFVRERAGKALRKIDPKAMPPIR